MTPLPHAFLLALAVATLASRPTQAQCIGTCPRAIDAYEAVGPALATALDRDSLALASAATRGDSRPDLYSLGIALDIAVAGIGAALLVASAVSLSKEDQGFGTLGGTFGLIMGGTLLALGGGDLVYVALGGDPMLVRTSRDRPPPRRPPILY